MLLHVPHADDLVEAGRGQRPSVGAEGDADDPAGVSLERRAEWRECARVTQPHSSVVAGRSEESPAGAERDAPDRAVARRTRCERRALLRVPESHGAVGARRSEHTSARREGDAPDLADVLAQRLAERLPCPEIPQAQRSVEVR